MAEPSPPSWAQRGALFDDVARLYDATRPGHPGEMIDAVAAAAGAGAEILEIGCGTGQATVPLAERGFPVVAIDRGRAMAGLCAAKCARFPHVAVECADLETWDARGRTFDLVLAAQCFHWTDRRVALDRVASFLRPGGAVALLWGVDRSEGTEYWRATQPAYARFLPNAGNEPPGSLPELIAQRREDLERHPAFGPVEERRCTWTHPWTADLYREFLKTNSPVRALPDAEREAFLAEMHAAALACGGEVVRRFESVLFVARRTSA